MDAIPLASSSVDYVYCCQVLHHNDLDGLRRTFAEIFRVLRPGGRLLVVNETLKTLRDPHGVHDEGVEQFEGYEHAHWAARYRWEAIRAGFLTEVTEPHYRPFFGDAELPPARLEQGRVRSPGGSASRCAASASCGAATWRGSTTSEGGVSMNMIATKPSRYVGRHDGMTVGERLLRSAAAGCAAADRPPPGAGLRRGCRGRPSRRLRSCGAPLPSFLVEAARCG